MLLPTTCPVCGRAGPSPCAPCRADLAPAPNLPPPVGVDACTAVLAYEDGGRELLARLKYRNARSALGWLAAEMAATVRASDVDVVTWVPTSPARRRRRGFDQAELLARAVARRLGRPCAPLLRRRPGLPQTGRSALERWSGPTFELRRRSVPARVLVVDDVVTTGATVAAAARTLRAGGAGIVRVCAGGRTSLKRMRTPSENLSI